MQSIKCYLADNKPVKGTGPPFGIPQSSLQCSVKEVVAKLEDIEPVKDTVLLEFIRDCIQRRPSNMSHQHPAVGGGLPPSFKPMRKKRSNAWLKVAGFVCRIEFEKLKALSAIEE
ncbi:unnamed protein product [Ceratitis capitata]|uniref:(Mediterranean fruit fly) hypothetical protein n=1 Tax=Ceratitis capitata TaxID=7213 RepID=A0A811V3Y3_CERCA|nr:unnamed protein product [Ceratitis capitata]